MAAGLSVDPTTTDRNEALGLGGRGPNSVGGTRRKG